MAAIAVRLYATNGTTLIGTLTEVRAQQWQDELSAAGHGSVEVSATDPLFASVTARRVIKFLVGGVVRFGFRILKDSNESAVEHGNERWFRVEGPGLLGMLADAVVLPEYGLARVSGADRRFGFMSVAGAWYEAADWDAPNAVVVTSHPNWPSYPANWPDGNAAWINMTPDSPVGGTTWFRGSFTTAAANPRVRVHMSCDDESVLYLDGEKVLDINGNSTSNRTTYTAEIPLSAGTHIVAAQVFDMDQWAGEASTAEIIVSITTVTPAGDPGTVIGRTTSGWLGHTSTNEATWPGFRRAQVLKKCFDEAKARGVQGLQSVTLGFNNDTDSNGQAWTDPHDDFSFPVATLTLDAVAAQLAEAEIDVWMDPATMVLEAYRRKGVINTDADLILGFINATLGNLQQYQTTSEATIVNDMYARLADGKWIHRTEGDSITAWGRVETGANLGSTNSVATGNALLDNLLCELGDETITIDAKPAYPISGILPWTDYDLGDTLTVPGHRGVGSIQARVLMISAEQNDDDIEVWPTLVIDRSL
jgi:hypothetical protein